VSRHGLWWAALTTMALAGFLMAVLLFVGL
jgi:hypothetical protein